jgi:hypothetical protein
MTAQAVIHASFGGRDDCVVRLPGMAPARAGLWTEFQGKPKGI